MDPLKQDVESAITSRRRRTTAHPWADAYLRAHGIEDAGLRAEILGAIVARAESRSQTERHAEVGERVMEEAQDFLDERLASFVGGLAPGHEAVAGRLVYWLADGPAQCPNALLDPTTAPAALRFQMRTARMPRTPTLVRASMVSRLVRGRNRDMRGDAPPRQQSPPQRWLRLVLCAFCLALVTCHP